jgi:NitT/TauT family transport system permease protein
MKEQTTRIPVKYYVLAFYLFLLGLWQLIFSLGIVKDYLFPSPVQVARKLYELVHEGLLWPSIKATVFRLAIGFSVASLIGLLLGLLMGISLIANRSMRSLFLGLQMLPTVAWVPMSLLVFGLSEKGIYFVIIMSAMPAIAIATSDGISQIPPIYLEAATTLGAPKYAMPFRVVFPAAFPRIITGLKLGWTFGYHGVVSAELIKSSIGMGYLLYYGRETNDAPQVVSMMLVTIAFGLLLDRFIFGIVEARVRSRWGLDAGRA